MGRAVPDGGRFVHLSDPHDPALVGTEDTAAPEGVRLTRRETQGAELVAQGLANQRIAAWAAGQRWDRPTQDPRRKETP
ncbi:hypothetical protein [Streptomyces sp. NPDC018693]|uniref:hypothetical protein n=1 Tax=unclassified Streptomyces TaxID=2593676 RepID=UPI0037946DB4